MLWSHLQETKQLADKTPGVSATVAKKLPGVSTIRMLLAAQQGSTARLSSLFTKQVVMRIVYLTVLVNP